jgi:uncharacterized protein
MFKFTACLVIAANFGLVSSPAISTTKMKFDLIKIKHETVSPLPVNNRIAADEAVSKDIIFDDIILNKVEKLKQFIDRGGNPNRYLHSAINAGSFDAVKMMIDRGANINLSDAEGVTSLMTSVRVTYRNGLEITKLLIKRGANINARAGKGSTALMYAAFGVAAHYEDEYVQVVRLLIKNGAKINVKNKMGDSPLSIAKSGNYKKIVAALKKSGAKY